MNEFTCSEHSVRICRSDASLHSASNIVLYDNTELRRQILFFKKGYACMTSVVIILHVTFVVNF